VAVVTVVLKTESAVVTVKPTQVVAVVQPEVVQPQDRVVQALLSFDTKSTQHRKHQIEFKHQVEQNP
jgi:hypothetical protein